MFLEISANNSKLRANLAEASSLIRDWSLLVTGLTSGITNAFSMISRVGIRAIQISLVGLIGTFGLAAKSGADFQDAMIRTFAILNENSSEAKRSFAELSRTAMNLGRDTLFSATQAAEGMQILAKSGFDVREIMQSIKPALDLAIVGNIELSESASYVVSALRSFNLETSEAKRVVDVFALGSSQANTTIDELGSALSFVAPVAAGAGLALEEVIATLGVLANRGIKGSKAGTTLRRAITQLIAPSGRAKKILSSLGLSFIDAAGNAEPLETVIRKLNKAGVTTAQTMEIFGLRAGPGMVALMKAGANSIGQLEAKLKDADGAADRMSQKLRTSVKGRVKDLMASINLLGISFDKSFKKPLADSIFGLRNFVVRLINVANRMGTFKAITDGVINAMQPFTDLVARLGDKFIEFLSKLTPQKIAKFFDELKNKVQSFVDIITSDEFRATVKETFNIIISLSKTFIENLKIIVGLWKMIPDSMRPTVSAMGLITAGFIKLFGGILNIIIFAISLKAVLITIGGQAAAIAGNFSVSAAIGAILLTTLEVIAVVLAVVASIFASIKFIQFLKDTKLLKTLWEEFLATIQTAWDLLIGIIDFIKGETDPFKNFKESLDVVLSKIERLKEIAKEAAEAIKKLLPTGLVESVGKIAKKVMGPVTGSAILGGTGTKKAAEGADTGFIEINGEKISVGSANKTLAEAMAGITDLNANKTSIAEIEQLGIVINAGITKLRDDQVAEAAALKAISAGLAGVNRQVIKPSINEVTKPAPNSGIQ